MMVKGLLFFLLFVWISAASGPNVYANEHGMDIQARKLGCRKLGGRCVKKRNPCPGHLPLKTLPGPPYCSSCRRCCYPAIISFDEFMSKYNKKYENESDAKVRIANFKNNVKVMEDHNTLYISGKSSFLMGVNEYSDMTYEEVVRELMGAKISDETRSHKRDAEYWYIPKGVGKEPEFMDYREKGAINPIRNQGSCGSCWAFSVTSSIESNIFLKNGELLQLSDQDLVDCSTGGCHGGWPKTAIKYVMDNGIAFRDDYPYTAKDGTCNEDAPKTSYKVIDIKQVKQNNDTELLNALVHMGPISICVYASRNMMQYRDGVLDDDLCTKSTRVNHAVVLVGYGTENGKDFWLIRNSWGESWGMDGYLKLARDKENICWISKYAYIPVIEDVDVCASAGGVRIGSQCLIFKMEKLNWNDAAAACANNGYQLASLAESPEEVLYYAVTKFDFGLFWAGGSDEVNEGSWVWMTGEAFDDQFPWMENEPNNAGGNENCLALYRVSSGAVYNDAPCDLTFQYICELDVCASAGGVRIGSQCLIFKTEKLNWNDAAAACANNGDQLASFAESPEEVLNYANIKYDFERFWAGGSDEVNEGSWVWMTGEAFDDQFPWIDNEPNNSGGHENCLAVYRQSGGAFYNDAPCDLTYRYICELGDASQTRNIKTYKKNYAPQKQEQQGNNNTSSISNNKMSNISDSSSSNNSSSNNIIP